MVEYGEPVLDLNNRFRVHALETFLREANLQGLVDTIPGKPMASAVGTQGDSRV